MEIFVGKIDFEKIALTVCVFEVTFVTAIMFEGWSDVPADFAWTPKVSLMSAETCAMTRVPRGAMGVRLKS